jgi:tRNA U34 5-carboxymethylaminomethyl modifying GTPase MnmE/TrmE
MGSALAGMNGGHVALVHVPGFRCQMEGLVELVDTAGLREAQDEIEQMGIQKSREALADADMVLLVLDATERPSPEELILLSALERRPAIVVENKMDLPQALPSLTQTLTPVMRSSASDRSHSCPYLFKSADCAFLGFYKLIEKDSRECAERSSPSKETQLHQSRRSMVTGFLSPWNASTKAKLPRKRPS